MRLTHFLIIFIFVVLACSQLFLPGFYTSHDGTSHLIKSFFFSRIIFSGHWPGWVNELNGFKGYPLFYFSYPLPYLLVTLGNILGLSLVDSIKTILFMCTWISAFFFYLWLNRFSRPGLSLISTVIFIFTPYRFLNLYVRMAFGEIVFVGLVPLTFYLLETRRFKLLSLSMAGLIISHLQLSCLFIPLFLGYVLVRRIDLFNYFLSLIRGLGLSAFFWLPSIILLPFTKFSMVTQNVSNHLVYFKQLLYSPWGFGFSGSGSTDGMSLQLGISGWLLLVISTLLYFKIPKTAKFIVIIVWLSLFMMIYSPWGFWGMSFISSFQFPWRLLNLPLLFIPVLLVFIKKPSKLFLVFLTLIALYTNRNHIRINLPLYQGVLDDYFNQPYTTATATPDEFMPKIQDKKIFTNHPVIMYSRIISLIAIGLLFVGKRKYATA